MSVARLTGIAHTMAALIPLYSRASGETEFRRLAHEELLSGFFRNDGGELHFIDGRAPLRDMAAARGDIEEVVHVLTPERDTIAAPDLKQ